MNANQAQLGRLEPVELRQAWLTEAGDFTPWLALFDNIELLGEAIGLELEVESQEKSVGPFRADILCRDTVNGHYVLIENQIERTDHGHLGQLLTYAAGLDAVTIVWVASRFTDEHRAALDWLNNATRPGIDFFGLEIELWRIGDSAMAPKFNVVSQPNDWSKTVREQAAAIQAGQYTDSQQRHLEFWTQFRRYLEETNSTVITNRPSKDHWTNVSVGRTDFSLVLFNNFKDGRSGVYLSVTGIEGKAHYRLLEERHRPRIDSVLGPLGEVLWRPMPDAKESQIAVRRLVSPSDPETWPALNAWMAKALMIMHDLFRPLIKTLDASAASSSADGVDAAAWQANDTERMPGDVKGIASMTGSDGTGDGGVSGTLQARLVALAAFLPVFEAADFQLGAWEGGEKVGDAIQMPYYSFSAEADRFISMAYEFGWVTPFDWGAWAGTPEGQRLLEGGDAIDAATPEDLGRVLTTIIRAERFGDGRLETAFRSGLLVAILRRAEALAPQESPSSSRPAR